jgi:RNA-directed DNA polymerase
MKRAGNLYDLICDPDNLRLAWIKAKRGKEGKEDVIRYGKQLNRNLNLLREQLLSGEPEIGHYHFFKIYEPKERLICAASFPIRVLHHAIMNVCHSEFEKFQIYHSYATRIGKGQFAALDYAKAKQSKFEWFCKLDIRKYFDSISQEILLQQLRKRFKDVRLLVLFEAIIQSYEVTPNHGLPIGNLTSQYFANFFLAFSDHYLLEKIRIPAYVRYMDDMVLWHHDKTKLIDAQTQLADFLKSALELNCKPACINKNDKGLPFLGYVVFPDRVRLNKQSKQRFIRKYKFAGNMLKSNIWSQADYARHIIPLIAFAKQANTYVLRKKIFNLNKEAG